MRYPCDKCEYAVTTSSYFKQHFESKHEGVRYPCDKSEYAAIEAWAVWSVILRLNMKEWDILVINENTRNWTEAGSLKRLPKSYHEGVGGRNRIRSLNVVFQFKLTNSAIQQTYNFTGDFKRSSFKWKIHLKLYPVFNIKYCENQIKWKLL